MSSGGNPLLPELEEGSDSEVLVTPTRSEDEVEKKRNEKVAVFQRCGCSKLRRFARKNAEKPKNKVLKLSDKWSTFTKH